MESIYTARQKKRSELRIYCEIIESSLDTTSEVPLASLERYLTELNILINNVKEIHNSILEVVQADDLNTVLTEQFAWLEKQLATLDRLSESITEK